MRLGADLLSSFRQHPATVILRAYVNAHVSGGDRESTECLIRRESIPLPYGPLRRFVDTYRTFCLAPGPEAKEQLLGMQQLTHLLAPGRTVPELTLPAHLEGNSGEVDFPGPAFSVGIPECPLGLALPLVGKTRITTHWERQPERLISAGWRPTEHGSLLRAAAGLPLTPS
jgi:hypothetical protein